MSIAALNPLVLLVLGAYLTYWFTKIREREAEWRKHKLEHYKELLHAISETAQTGDQRDVQTRYARATNVIGLVASPEVISAMQRHRDSGLDRVPWTTEDQNEHDAALMELVLAMRQDLGVAGREGPDSFHYKLWSVRGTPTNSPHVAPTGLSVSCSTATRD